MFEPGREQYAWERHLLEVCDLYLVGGTVREILRGGGTGSVDEDYLASGIEYDDLVSRLERFGSVNLVGKSFGVIKFTPPSQRTVDVSLPRTEFSTGIAHRDFSVTFDPRLPVEKDLERRDFTVNSMALHLGTRILVDPLGGRSDLEKRLLKVNRRDSFLEDPLRILRGVQLMARLDFAVEEETRADMRKNAALLESVSAERLRDELNKLLELSDKPSRGFIFMHEEGILPFVLPELEATFGEEQNEFHPDDVFMHSLKSCDRARPELHLRWSALLHDIGKKEMKQVVDGRTVFYRHEEASARDADAILERLRFPRELRKKVVALVVHHMFNITDDWSDAAVRRFIVRVGRENLDDLLALREADGLSRGDDAVIAQNASIRERLERVLASEAAFKIRDLAIGGADIIEALGIGEGPEVGKILRKLFEAVLENPEENTREKLISLVLRSGEKE
jgi:poly(A) polymerase/tRNA nucleotidyltransferase (CCA-adding enzyme)